MTRNASRAPVDPGLQPERTALSWERTGLSLAVGAVGVARHALTPAGLFVLVPCSIALVCGLWVFFRGRRRGSWAIRHPDEPGFVVMRDGRLTFVIAALLTMLCIGEVVAAAR